MRALTVLLGLALSASALSTAADTLNETIADEVAAVTDRVVAWRRTFIPTPSCPIANFVPLSLSLSICEILVSRYKRALLIPVWLGC